MNSRNDRDQTRDRSGRPVVQVKVEGRFTSGPRAAGSLFGIWRWSRHRLTRAACLMRRLFGRDRCPLCLRVGSRCVKGPIREVNEDRCYADQRRGLFVVADGMGGHVGGEQASQTVIEVIASQLGHRLDGDDMSESLLASAIRKAIVSANEELMQMARVDVGLSGMGSTAVVGIVQDDRLLLCSVGDSRTYLCRQHQLRQLTEDDTLVQGLVSAGALTAAEAAKHPMRHVLLHSVGTRKLEKMLRVESHPLQSGDRLLFTTDGLTDAVNREEVIMLLDEHPDPQIAAAELADFAQQAGSRDNITCIVVDLLAS